MGPCRGAGGPGGGGQVNPDEAMTDADRIALERLVQDGREADDPAREVES